MKFDYRINSIIWRGQIKKTTQCMLQYVTIGRDPITSSNLRDIYSLGSDISRAGTALHLLGVELF